MRKKRSTDAAIGIVLYSVLKCVLQQFILYITLQCCKAVLQKRVVACVVVNFGGICPVCCVAVV